MLAYPKTTNINLRIFQFWITISFTYACSLVISKPVARSATALMTPPDVVAGMIADVRLETLVYICKGIRGDGKVPSGF